METKINLDELNAKQLAFFMCIADTGKYKIYAYYRLTEIVGKVKADKMIEKANSIFTKL